MGNSPSCRSSCSHLRRYGVHEVASRSRMLKNSQAVRFGMAAGMYLLLMWGYIVLPSAQWYAAFLALIMCIMLVFWVSESSADLEPEAVPARKPGMRASRPERHGVTMSDWGQHSSASGSHAPAPISNLEASFLRLESIKSDLKVQYAQFGRDQSLINSKGLGSWHGNNQSRGN